MKIVGYTLIGIGLALLLFVVYSIFKEDDYVASPIPETKGVKVIELTPTR